MAELQQKVAHQAGLIAELEARAQIKDSDGLARAATRVALMWEKTRNIWSEGTGQASLPWPVSAA